jgi:large subunit ribosomal protein L30
MMAIKIKLVRSMSGHTEKHRETLRGLGLTRVGVTRIVADTKPIRGMVEKIAYLCEVAETTEEAKPFGRRFRAKQQAAAAAAAKK